MPVMSTLGSLTYTKTYLGDIWTWYAEFTPGSNNQFDIENFAINNDDVYIGGVVYSNATIYNPQFIKITNSNVALPTNPYHATYISGSTRRGNCTSVSYESTSNTVYASGFQSVVSNAFTYTAGITRKLDSNGALQATYVDLPTATNRNRDVHGVVGHANGTYTTVGFSQETSTNSIGYITNFTGNVKNYAKTFGGPAGAIHFKMDSFGNPVVTLDANVAVIASNGNTILRQFTTTPVGTAIVAFDTDSSNNIYYTTGNSTITNLVKIDQTGNILWQKQMSGNIQTNSAVQLTSISVIDGNVFVAGQANSPGGNISNGFPLAIMSFDSATGNINWQNQFNKNGNLSTVDPKIQYSNGDLYVSGWNSTSTKFGFLTKVAASGAIPGNGVYSGNLTYKTSNVTISNANVTITTGNLSLANAVSTAVVTSTITANTSNVWTFNPTRLS